MGPLLDALSREPAGERKPIPKDVKTEAAIAERVLSDVSAVNGLGALVPYNCLRRHAVGDAPPGRQALPLHTGHSFTAASLLVDQTEKIEETLWTSLRMFEERKTLLKSTAGHAGAGGTATSRRRSNETQRAERAQQKGC